MTSRDSHTLWTTRDSIYQVLSTSKLSGTDWRVLGTPSIMATSIDTLTKQSSRVFVSAKSLVRFDKKSEAGNGLKGLLGKSPDLQGSGFFSCCSTNNCSCWWSGSMLIGQVGDRASLPSAFWSTCCHRFLLPIYEQFLLQKFNFLSHWF